MSRAAIVWIFSIILIPVFLLAGCSAKSYTRPRSELVTEAISEGKKVRTVEEDQKLFAQSVDENRNRLLDLIRSRSGKEPIEGEYHLGQADEVEIAVFDVPEMNLTSRVSASGTINLPLLGAVQAAGLSESELTKSIHDKLARFIRDPQVRTVVTTFGSQKVAVLGAIRRPGAYSLKKNSTSVLEILSEAGGLSPKAGNFIQIIPSEVSGLRPENTAEARAELALATTSTQDSIKSSRIEVYIDQIMGTSSGMPIDVPVRGGDMIIIPDSGQVQVEGEVDKVGSYELGQQLSLLGALAAAGGITYGAKIDEIEVVREIGIGDRVSLVVDLEKLATGAESDVRLRNGDIVRVPTDTGRRLSQDTFESISRVLNLGVGGHFDVKN